MYYIIQCWDFSSSDMVWPPKRAGFMQKWLTKSPRTQRFSFLIAFGSTSWYPVYWRTLACLPESCLQPCLLAYHSFIISSFGQATNLWIPPIDSLGFLFAQNFEYWFTFSLFMIRSPYLIEMIKVLELGSIVRYSSLKWAALSVI